MKNLERLHDYDNQRRLLPHRVEAEKQKNRKLLDAWRNNIANGFRTEHWRKAEEIAPQILAKEGFTDMQHTRFSFPFDYWGRLEGKPVAIEVTSTYKRQKKSFLKKFLDFSGWQYFVLFISPDMKRYSIKDSTYLNIVRAIRSQKDIQNLKEVGT